MTIATQTAFALESELPDDAADADPEAFEGLSNQELLQRLGLAHRASEGAFVVPLEENRWWEDLDRWV
jgi:hypothetical protein